jgi:hypothetical protein
VALPFTLKSILRQKKNFGNPKKETKIRQDDHNSINNLKFPSKPKYHLSKILA